MNAKFENNAQTIIQGINKLKNNATDTGPLMKKIAADMETKVAFRFKQGKAPDGSKWEPLKDSTIANRRNGSDKPLRDSGDLALSINHKYTNTEAIAGSDRSYSAYQNNDINKTQSVKEHTRKTKSGRRVNVRSHSRNMVKPGRQFIGFSKNQMATYRKWINEYFRDKK